MLEFTDPRWTELISGYRLPFDPRPALTALEAGSADAWTTLWEELHHQDDVDTASYAAVPHIVRIYQASGVPDWNPYALVGTIELARKHGNPAIPVWLEPGYTEALRSLASTGLDELRNSHDLEFVQCALGLVALVSGHRRAGELLLVYTEGELAEMLGE